MCSCACCAKVSLLHFEFLETVTYIKIIVKPSSIELSLVIQEPAEGSATVFLISVLRDLFVGYQLPSIEKEPSL